MGIHYDIAFTGILGCLAVAYTDATLQSHVYVGEDLCILPQKKSKYPINPANLMSFLSV